MAKSISQQEFDFGVKQVDQMAKIKVLKEFQEVVRSFPSFTTPMSPEEFLEQRRKGIKSSLEDERRRGPRRF